jgi:hypothetical protein
MMILVAGAVLVAALVVWALTRTVEPTPDATPVADATTTTGGFAGTPTPQPTTALPTTTGPIANTSTSPLSPAVSATTPPPPQPTGDRAEVKRIAVEDVRAKHTRGEVTIVDVRDAASFARGHIPGSINIPFASIEAQVDRIPKGKAVITLCT